MAKPSKRQRKTHPVKKETKKAFSIPEKQQDLIFILIILVLLVILLKPLVIDKLSPQGVDVVGSLGKGHQVSEYLKNTGERALWNPSIFAGMPIYHRYSPAAFSADNLLQFLGRLLNIVFIYYFFAAIGIYFLFRYLKMSPLISFIGTVIFILMPHYKSLYQEGHFAKFKALMFLPWIFLTFKYFLDRRTILAAALFAIAFGTQIRTQHYQIIFYSGLLVFAIGIYPFIKDLLDKKFSLFFKSTALLIIALAFSITMSAQPLFLAKEYLPYSKRGKTTIDIKQETAQRDVAKADGVSMQYATQWSTHPSELLTWFIPRFYGGMSAEKYNGSNVPRAKGQMISGYWGYMPFTQSYEYMGVISLLLAFIGLFFYRKDKTLISLAIFTLFLVLLSFGRHFQSFYSLFYYHVPFFNKFRAPMMSVSVTFFAISIFAAFGLKYLSQLKIEKVDLKKHKNLLFIIAGFFVLGILLWLAGQTFSFTKLVGERYQGQTLELIRAIRKEYFNHDVIRYIIFVLLSGGSIVVFFMKKINFTVLGLILAVLIIFDLINIQNRVHKDYINLERLEKQYFRQTPTDRFLLADKEIFRIFPAGKLFGDNRWAYYHQTIGGYTPIKMYTIEELVEKNIYNGWDPALPLNWNVLKILNVKYLILQSEINSDKMTLVNSDKANKQFTCLFNERLPRGFFVSNYKVVKDEYDRIRTINSREFDPANTAILEEALTEEIAPPDSASSKLIDFNPNRLIFEVFTDKQALFVISELYYPPGWKIFIDDQQVEKIYKTDHAIQSIVVPEGKHKIDIRFEPESYYRNIKVAYFSVGILYLIVLFSLVGYFIQKRRQ